ncbi:MAG: ComEC/Rec2 family competence protein [Bacteroidota bacterium]
MNLDFYKRPFAHICIPFIVGLALVLVSGTFANSLILVLSLFVGLLAFWKFINAKSGIFAYLSAYGLSFLLGSFVATLHVENQVSIFQSGYKNGSLIQGEITEISNGNGQWNKAIVKANTLHFDKKKNHTDACILVYLSKELSYLQKGDEVLIGAEITKIKNKNNPGEFDAEYYWKSRGIDAMAFVSSDELTWVDSNSPSFLSYLLTGFSEYLNSTLKENLTGTDLAIAQALILGDKSLLDTETKNAFTNTGAMHILAVSGMHVGLILYLFLAIFGFFPRLLSKKQATIAIVIFLWIYAFITGLSASVLRAVLMFTVLALSQISSKQHDSINTLFFSAFVLLLINPLYVLDIGFQLSYLAMIGIFLFYPKVEKLLEVKTFILKELWQGTALGFAAQLMTTGISLFYFHQFPNYFVLSNLGLMFFSSIVMGLGFFLFAVKYVPVLSNFIGVLLGFSVFAMYWIVQKIEEIPGAVAYGYVLPFWIVILLSLLFIFLVLYAKSRKQISIGYSVYFLVLLALVVQRNQMITKTELCIFNHNQFVATIKIKNKIHCFYRAKPEQVEKVKMVVESYAKLNPGEISYHDINRKKVELKIENQKVEISDKGNLIQLTWNKKKFDVLFQLKESDNTQILMPWLTEGNGYLLNKGAFVQKG